MEWSNDSAPLLRLSVLPSCGESSKWYKWCKFRHGAMEWPRWLVSLMRPASANQRPGSRSRDHYRPIRAQETWSPEPEHYIIQTQWYSEYILDLHYHHNVLQKIGSKYKTFCCWQSDMFVRLYPFITWLLSHHYSYLFFNTFADTNPPAVVHPHHRRSK